MKKILTIILAISMCFVFVACRAGNNEQEVNREIVSIDVLIDSLDNLARAEQNIGKATYLFGTVQSIGTESFVLEHIFIGKSFEIKMQKSTLIELNKGDFIAIYAVIDKVTENGSFAFTDCEIAEMELMDEYIVNAISYRFKFDSVTLLTVYSDIISEYVISRDNVFKMTDDEEIASYIVGEWLFPYGDSISTLEYFADGECIWQCWDNYFNDWRDAYTSWNVENGIFDGCSADTTSVYKITDDVMVTANELCIREN